MSPHGIAGPPDQKKFTKFGEKVSIGQTLKATKFRRAQTKSVRDIRCRIFFSRKSGQKLSSPKSAKTCYAPMPLILPNFIALGQTMYEKSVIIFLHPSVFWSLRDYLS